MRVVRAAAAIAALTVGAGEAAAQRPQAPPPSQTPPPASAPAPAAPGPPRTFSAPVGLIFNTVRPERVADFEKAMGYVQAALGKSTDPRVQAQARGWRMFKASEPGPNGTVLYVFEFDPAVSGADYGLGRILADAFPDTAQLQEIWRLYTGAVTSGGTLLNLTPLMPPAPSAGEPRGTTSPPATPDTTTPPIDANPNVPPTPGR